MTRSGVCPICGAPFVLRKPTQRTCSAPCRNADTSRRTAAKRGDVLRGRGEGRTKYRKRNGRHEHRVVAEEILGRPLAPGEIVHHVNEDTHDNGRGNLVVLPSQAEHAREHSTGRRCPEGCTCARHDSARWKRRKGFVQ